MHTAPKILIIVAGSYISGAEKVTLDVVRYLKEKGYNVHCLVTGWNDGKYIQCLQQMNVAYTIHKLGWYYTSKIGWTIDSLVHYPKAVWIFLKLLKKFKPDLLYTNSYRPVFLLRPFLKANIVYHAHDPHGETRQGRIFLKLIDKKIARYIAVSSYIQKDLLQCGIAANKIELIYNGVQRTAEPIAVSSRQYMPAGTLRIGIAGQIIPRKGHQDLLLALESIRGSVPFECLIFGGSNNAFTNQLKQLIKQHGLCEQVIWNGFVNDKNDIYPLIDILVAPTRNDEPFGLVAAEAGAFSVCSVVTDSGGLPEIVVDGQTGFVVPKQSPAAIAEKLTLVYNNPYLLKELGENAAQRVKEKFTLGHMEKRIGLLFDQFFN
jgi:glycosyltransferase involved in cell wall biosynthesis